MNRDIVWREVGDEFLTWENLDYNLTAYVEHKDNATSPPEGDGEWYWWIVGDNLPEPSKGLTDTLPEAVEAAEACIRNVLSGLPTHEGEYLRRRDAVRSAIHDFLDSRSNDS